ncbi:MAG: hypothetical protein HGA36_03090 [Candidatus Moranbacteria bacterium]|nr:hypothetical protein [Candidatus Moranbacteria bacterium]
MSQTEGKDKKPAHELILAEIRNACNKYADGNPITSTARFVIIRCMLGLLASMELPEKDLGAITTELKRFNEELGLNQEQKAKIALLISEFS